MDSISFVNAPHTIIRMLYEVEQYRGCDLTWYTNKGFPFKKIFPKYLYKEIHNISEISKFIVEIGSVKKINEFLNENGFAIKLNEPVDKQSVSVASIIEISVKWSGELEAKETQIKLRNDTLVPAVCVKNVTNIGHIKSHKFPIIELDTCSKERVFITQFVKKPISGLTGLFKIIQSWKKEIKEDFSNRINYSGKVIFPMVDFSRKGNIEELILATGLDFNNNMLFLIGEAKYQHILKINSEGALAKAAAACTSFLCGGEEIDINIDTSFVIWFEHEGVIPFCAYITEKDMRTPKNLT